MHIPYINTYTMHSMHTLCIRIVHTAVQQSISNTLYDITCKIKAKRMYAPCTNATTDAPRTVSPAIKWRQVKFKTSGIKVDVVFYMDVRVTSPMYSNTKLSSLVCSSSLLRSSSWNYYLNNTGPASRSHVIVCIHIRVPLGMQMTRGSCAEDASPV